MENAQGRDHYIENAKEGTIVAFTWKHGGSGSPPRTLSGMIVDAKKDSFVVKTLGGTQYHILKEDIIWVKSGRRWPKGVYQALRGGHLHEVRD